MFAATRKAHNKMVKTVTTQDLRIINTNKTSTREIKLQNRTTDNNQRKKMKILLKNMHILTVDVTPSVLDEIHG